MSSLAEVKTNQGGENSERNEHVTVMGIRKETDSLQDSILLWERYFSTTRRSSFRR